MKYDLEQRTSQFSENVIDFVKELSLDNVNTVLIKQIIRSSTSIGANYMEADSGESRKDFSHKIAICRKEAKETCYWLKMLMKTNPSRILEIRPLMKESRELVLIFSRILISSRSKEK